jgi:hypothetical protein
LRASVCLVRMRLCCKPAKSDARANRMTHSVSGANICGLGVVPQATLPLF